MSSILAKHEIINNYSTWKLAFLSDGYLQLELHVNSDGGGPPQSFGIATTLTSALWDDLVLNIPQMLKIAGASHSEEQRIKAEALAAQDVRNNWKGIN